MAEAFVTSIGTAVPPHAIAQERIADFMARMLQIGGDEKMRLQKMYANSGIRVRHSVIDDYARERGEFRFYANTPDLEPFPGVEARMALYREFAAPLAEEAVRTALEHAGLDARELDHVITVSCTGMYAPGLDIDLVERLGLDGSTRRTCVNFMGCYAAFNGLKVADAIVQANPRARVAVVCVELCTLHFQKLPTMDHIVANSLFADGAAVAIVEGAPRPGRINLALDAFHAELAPDSRGHMAWNIGDTGFLMTLSRYVADLVEGGIGALTESLLSRAEIHRSAIGHWAIHPGGRRILDACRMELGLDEADLQHSRSVLRDYGNMSSATILFVLERLLEDLRRRDAADGERVFAAAFGPGLTMESAVLRVVRPHADA